MFLVTAQRKAKFPFPYFGFDLGWDLVLGLSIFLFDKCDKD